MIDYFESRIADVRGTEDSWDARRVLEQSCKRDMALAVLLGRYPFPPDLLEQVLAAWRRHAPEFNLSFTSHADWQRQMCVLLETVDGIFRARAERGHPYGTDFHGPVAEVLTHFHARVGAQNERKE